MSLNARNSVRFYSSCGTIFKTERSPIERRSENQLLKPGTPISRISKMNLWYVLSLWHDVCQFVNVIRVHQERCHLLQIYGQTSFVIHFLASLHIGSLGQMARASSSNVHLSHFTVLGGAMMVNDLQKLSSTSLTDWASPSRFANISSSDSSY
jgi:hypothetical protein